VPYFIFCLLLVHAISDILKVPILIFQACNNLAGYVCVDVTSPLQEEAQSTRIKMICLTKNKNYYDTLVVIDSKETEFHNRLVELLHHFTPYQMKVLRLYVILSIQINLISFHIRQSMIVVKNLSSILNMMILVKRKEVVVVVLMMMLALTMMVVVIMMILSMLV